MAAIPTVRVRRKDDGHDCVINASDFDGARHDLLVESVAPSPVGAPGAAPNSEQEHDNHAPDPAEDDSGADDGAAPIPDLQGLNVGQAAAVIACVDDLGVLDALAEAETRGKNRTGALKLIRERWVEIANG